MKKIDLSDIIPYNEYLKIRKEFQDKIIKIKKNRRVQVGDFITFVFENRDTVLYQIQEMIRLEKMTDIKLIRNEIDVFNELIPDENELCATMFIEVFQRHLIKSTLNSLIGIHNQKVFLEVGDVLVPAIFTDQETMEAKISAVHYVRFSLDEVDVKNFLNENVPTKIKIKHENYLAEALIPENVRKSLIEDLLQK